MDIFPMHSHIVFFVLCVGAGPHSTLYLLFQSIEEGLLG